VFGAGGPRTSSEASQRGRGPRLPLSARRLRAATLQSLRDLARRADRAGAAVARIRWQDCHPPCDAAPYRRRTWLQADPQRLSRRV